MRSLYGSCNFKRSRKLLLALYASLKNEDKRAVDIMLWYHDDLRKAHVLKKFLYEIMKMKSKKEERKQLDIFIKECEKIGIKKFVTLGNTYRNFRGYIIKSFFPLFQWSHRKI